MKFSLCAGVTLECVEGNRILTTEQGDAAILNETAAHMVDLLLDGYDADAVADRIASEYEADIETIYSDVETLLTELAAKKLVVFCQK